jgi:hypothetical protein
VLALGVFIALAACNSTPMPIPPSVDVDPALMQMELTDPTPDCMESCIRIWGIEGAVSPAASIVISRLHASELDMPRSNVTTAGPFGEFETVLGGEPEGVYRMVVQLEGGLAELSVRPIIDAGPTWFLEEVPEPLDRSCLWAAPERLDFGEVDVDDADTLIVDVTNGCDHNVEIIDAYVMYEPWNPIEPALAGLARDAILVPGGTAGVAVLFWPLDPGEYEGALVIEVLDLAGTEITTLSVPVRAEAR